MNCVVILAVLILGILPIVGLVDGLSVIVVMRKKRKEMNNEQEQKYREEFEALIDNGDGIDKRCFNKSDSGEYLHKYLRDGWSFYLSACKKRQEEFNSKDNYYLKFKQIELEITALRAENEKLKSKQERVYLQTCKDQSEINQLNEDMYHLRNELETLKKELERQNDMHLQVVDRFKAQTDSMKKENERLRGAVKAPRKCLSCGETAMWSEDIDYREQNTQLKSALLDFKAMVEHAIELEYLGEGSTLGWAKQLLEKHKALMGEVV